MSLQIWLPLIEDYHNQGLSNLTFSPIAQATDMSFVNDGKLGKCFENTASLTSTPQHWNRGGLESNQTINLGNNFSMFCWVNFNELYSKSILNGIMTSHIANESSGVNAGLSIRTITTGAASTGKLSFIAGNDTTRTYAGNYNTTMMQAGQWYHVGLTYDGTNVKLYTNGTLEDTIAYTISTTANNIRIAKYATSSDGYGLNGKINDVRIYNHCLSAKEVEEISKGLLIHYMLSPQNLINKNIMTLNKYIKSDGTVGDSSNWCISDYIPVTPGQVYNAIGFASGGNSVPCIVTYSSSQVKKRNFNVAPNENYTITIAEDEFYIRLSVRTTNNEIDTAGFYLSNGTIYDCSGYANNATVYTGNSTTLLAPDSPSPRYDKATQCNNSPIKTDSIIIPSDNSSNIFSIAAWVKIATTTPNRMWFGTGSTNNSLWFWINGNGFCAGRSGNNSANNNVFYQIDSPTTAVSRTAVSVDSNEWHHYCITNNGTVYNLHIDGNKVGQTNNNASQTNLTLKGKVLYIGGFADNNTTYNLQAGDSISDFRLYTTVLTENQVKELYNTSMAIDNNGNIYARELVEE